jgi:hypothetical protein
MKSVKPLSKAQQKKISSVHKKGLQDFINHFSKQKKIKSPSDLLSDMMYGYMTSTNGSNHVLCILRQCPKGCKFDCMLNIEAREFGEEITYTTIFVHKPKTPLWDVKNWEVDKI